ncbi:MAG TPA: 4Fe-4S dicluster domain-containing protein [Chloroflexota bacterium]|nr:4Fe-4S dicluster domain-containing protein [Chloroflexota bacterium]
MRRGDRRHFLKIAGLLVIGVGFKPAIDLLSGGGQVAAAGQNSEAAPEARKLAMVIDVARCVEAGDCTDCIAACNRAHNIPRFENPKEEIKWIWKDSYLSAFPDTAGSYTASSLQNRQIPLLCNHCDEPACVRVCPTRATWKREDGIVMMDEHRCIGCRYCMTACPYGARSFNYRDPRHGLDGRVLNPDFPTRAKGVVEKCNFCVERIDDGGVPACVDACRRKAMVFGDLNDPRSQVRALLESRTGLRRDPRLGTNPKLYYLV